MADTTTERAACEHCGADVRDGTTFCYNCGKSVAAAEKVHVSNGAAPVSGETKAALDDLANRLSVDQTTSEENKLAQAAAERKRARVRARRSEVVWEPAADVNGLFIVFTLAIVVVAALIVFAAVIWK